MVCVCVCVCVNLHSDAVGLLQCALKPPSTHMEGKEGGGLPSLSFRICSNIHFSLPPSSPSLRLFLPPLCPCLRPQQRALRGVDSAQQESPGEGPMCGDSAATTGAGRSGSAPVTPNETDPLCVHARPELEATRLRHCHGDSRPAVEACMAVYAWSCHLVSAQRRHEGGDVEKGACVSL